MYLDTQEFFSSAQSLAAAVGDLASANVYDTGAAADVGIGEEMYLQVNTLAGVTSGGAATIQVVLQSDDNSGFASPKEFVLTSALPLASLTANKVLYQGRLPIGLERYLRVVYRIGGAAVTGGTANAFMAKNLQLSPALPTSVPGVK